MYSSKDYSSNSGRKGLSNYAFSAAARAPLQYRPQLRISSETSEALGAAGTILFDALYASYSAFEAHKYSMKHIQKRYNAAFSRTIGDGRTGVGRRFLKTSWGLSFATSRSRIICDHRKRYDCRKFFNNGNFKLPSLSAKNRRTDPSNNTDRTMRWRRRRRRRRLHIAGRHAAQHQQSSYTSSTKNYRIRTPIGAG